MAGQAGLRMILRQAQDERGRGVGTALTPGPSPKRGEGSDFNMAGQAGLRMILRQAQDERWILGCCVSFGQGVVCWRWSGGGWWAGGGGWVSAEVRVLASSAAGYARFFPPRFYASCRIMKSRSASDGALVAGPGRPRRLAVFDAGRPKAGLRFGVAAGPEPRRKGVGVGGYRLTSFNLTWLMLEGWITRAQGPGRQWRVRPSPPAPLPPGEGSDFNMAGQAGLRMILRQASGRTGAAGGTGLPRRRRSSQRR